MQIPKIKSRQTANHKHNAVNVITRSPNIIPTTMTIDPDDFKPNRIRGKHILVLGATGRLGTQVVSQALESSYHVTALVRSDSNLPFARHQLRNPNLVIMVGSILSREDLDRVIEGKDVVINCIGPKLLFPSSDDMDICSCSQKLIIESMIHYKVRRLIVVTSQNVVELVDNNAAGDDHSNNNNNNNNGNDNDNDNNNNYNNNNDNKNNNNNNNESSSSSSSSSPSKIPIMQKFVIKFFTGKVLNDKKLQETIIINNSDHIDWTIIRPGRLYNGQLTEQYKLNDKSNFTKVSRANVAHFIMKELRNDDWLMKTPTINS